MRDFQNGSHVVVKTCKTARAFEGMGDTLYRLASTVAQGSEYAMSAMAHDYDKMDDTSAYSVMSVPDWNTRDSGNGNAFLEAAND